MAVRLPLLAALRDARWLTAERARAYCRVLAAVELMVAVAWVALSRHGFDPAGHALGTDFVSFWTAARTALAGHAAAVYDPALHHAAEVALFHRDPGDFAFFYPPSFLLLCLPLGLVGYLPALFGWLGVTGLAAFQAIRELLAERGTGLAIAAYPAVLLNIGHGQNGFLTTALFGAAALSLDTRPVIAGLCYGLLAYKPQFGLAIPIALLAARRWRSFLAAALAALALTAASALAFGLPTWHAFLALTPLARTAMEQTLMGPGKMQSAFAAVRLLHGGVGLAYLVQAVCSLAVLGALVALHLRRPPAPAAGATIAAASLLVTPFVLDYDLVLAAVPLAWVFACARRTGFLPWEKTVLAAAFAWPLVGRLLGAALGLPLGPLVLGALFAVTFRRAALATSSHRGD